MSIEKDCPCGVCAQFPRSIYVPIGKKLSDKIEIREIDYDVACDVVEAHHSYMDRPGPVNTVKCHGIYLKGYLAGCVCYSEPIASIPLEGIEKGEYKEVSRVCIVPDIPNLASCGMANSQKLFERTYAAKNSILALFTFIIDEKKGSMFAALRGLGWERIGEASSKQPGNRRNKEVYGKEKDKWMCRLSPHEHSHSVLDF